jgi:hypothetical protein
MDLTIIDATGNKSIDVTVPDNVPAGRLVGKAVDLLSLPQVGDDNYPLSYTFHHKQSGRQLGDNESLIGAGVGNNDVLRLVPQITAG